MSQTGVDVYETAEALYRAAAERIAETLRSAIGARGDAYFVLTGGNTPKPVYESLAAPPFNGQLDWSRVHFFWGDERCVPPDDPASNYRMAWKALISRLSVPAGNIHRIAAELPDPEDAARRYEAEIRGLLSRESPPAFDLVLLGMGEDGHTASLFPGTVWDETKWVVANYVTGLKAYRVTMTPLLLNSARKVIFLTSGAGKARALAGVLEDPAAAFPAKRIRPRSGDLTWMIDQAAATLLSRQPHKM